MISVIVPIYKVEKYLPKCIDSLINQTYRDIEIILVDDGSPDGCPKICDAYAAKDPRIVVIHQANSGVAVARNAGLDMAKGEYVGFCDADDYIDNRMYETLLNAFPDVGAQISICGYDYVDEEGNVTRPYKLKEKELLNQKDMYRRFFDMPPSIRLGVCNKLFFKSLLQDIRFTVGIKGAEDAEFLGKYLKKVTKAVFVHEPLYKNCERRGSATRGGLKADSVLPALDIYKEIANDSHTVYPELDRHAQAYYLDACLLGYNEYCVKGETSQAESLKHAIRKNVGREFPSFLFNREIHWKTRIYYLLFFLGLKG